MTIDKQLIRKSYYETLVIGVQDNHPSEVLGAMYETEQHNESKRLADIRFGQGEVYYHTKDLEAAIFKWEKVDHELAPWAKKNIADCYYELGLLERAEELYLEIETDSSTLTSEISLQLFSLYVEQQREEQAFKVIGDAVVFDPDYPNVTALARTFYEEQRDWKSAIDLAAKEAIRTQTLRWFEILQGYVEQGYTKDLAPGYFYELLSVLYGLDQAHFVTMTSALWNSYKEQDSYLAWLQIINLVFTDAEVNYYDAWQETIALYEEAYAVCMGGRYFIQELHDVVPGLLTNWLKLTHSAQAILPAAAVLAWDEMFTNSIEEAAVQRAREMMSRAPYREDLLQRAMELFSSITSWSEAHDLPVGPRWDWWAQELAQAKTRHIVVAGVTGNGTSSFINSLIGESVLGQTANTVIVIDDHIELEMTVMTEQTVRTVANLAELELTTEADGALSMERAYAHVKVPSQFLQSQAITLIEMPVFHSSELIEHAQTADGLLVILDVNKPFTEREREAVLEVQRQLPQLPIHFILNKMDTIYSEQEVIRITDRTSLRIQDDVSRAKLLPYSSLYAGRQQQGDVADFLAECFAWNQTEETRSSKLLYFIKSMLVYVLRKREERERSLAESIEWDEDLLSKFYGAIHQVQDLEQKKAAAITKAYRMVKDAIHDELTENIPRLLKETADILNEESDFRNVDDILNEEMNKRVHQYLQQEILPQCLLSLQEWISSSHEELAEVQEYTEEMANGFNALYGKQRLSLVCDFRVLADWQRDAERVTSTAQIGEMSFFPRTNASQLLLKGAGKLFGSFGQNRKMLYTQYKKLIEQEDYNQVTAAVTKKFLMQFELLESGLVRDIGLFFREPLAVLHAFAEETDAKIKAEQQQLGTMKERPEIYRDPLTLFELQLHQYEWIAGVAEEKELIEAL